MKLKCRINGKEYDIVQGASFTDNLNETLDSGTICIDQVPEITDLKPYDDVYIWDSSEEFEGYYNKGDWISIETDISKEISSYGDGETTSFGYDEYDSITHNAICSLSPLLYVPNKYVLQGSAVSIFIDMMENGYTILTRNNFRYSLPMIRISGRVLATDSHGLAFLKLINFDLIRNQDDEYQFVCYDDGKEYVIRCELNKDKTLSFYNNYAQNENFGSLKDLELVSGSLIEKQGFHKVFTIDFGQQFELNCEVQDFVISVKYRGRWYDFNATFNNPNEEPQNPSSRLAPPGGGILITRALYVSNSLLNIHTVFLMTYDRDSRKYNLSITQPRYGSIFDLIDDIKISTIVVQSYLGSPLPQKFFKHMLIDSFNHIRLNLGNELRDQRVLYKYTINLFSEIKKLEKIILPNTTITQSLVTEKKRTCWEYLQNFVELYSPKYKKVVNGEDKKWQYVQKYSLSENINEYLEKENEYGQKLTQYITNLKEVFENTICPEMSWTAPSLRDVLNQIFSVKDLIPVVFNDVIYGLNIGALDENLPNFDRTGVNFDTGSMSSSDYATDARREYGGALSQENSAHMIEYLGFRSPNGPFLDISSMVIETRFPIYKINTIKLCYYKKYRLIPINNEDNSLEPIDKMFMCKYDITPLIVQNVVRNSLSVDYRDFNKEAPVFDPHKPYIEKLKEMSKYKLCTIGYDIGSNVISGWGTQYEYIDFLWFKEGKTYIENIVNILDDFQPEGTSIFKSELQGGNRNYVPNFSSERGVNSIVPLDDGVDNNDTSKYKSIVFEVDYDAMYSGAVVHSKDFIEDDDITTVDNCSTSLAVLETDGLFEKEKLNRMSNKQFKFTARYDERTGGALYSNIQELGTLDREYTNATIYSREYQIYDTCILANYSASYNYILKNYFTSVWAKYRTYSFMSYGESVKRTENRRQLILLSTDKQYYEEEGLLENNPQTFVNLFNFLFETEHDNVRFLPNTEVINCGYFQIEGKRYLSDINSFASGPSLCFNIATYDNISGGTYVGTLSGKYTIKDTFITAFYRNFEEDKDKADEILKNYRATQGWHKMVTDDADAFEPYVGVYVCHLDEEQAYGTVVSEGGKVGRNGERLRNLPLLSDDILEYRTNIIGQMFKLNKDNKERLDFTFQFDYISSDKSKVMTSPWVSKLNDLIGVYKKRSKSVGLTVEFAGNVAGEVFLCDEWNLLGVSYKWGVEQNNPVPYQFRAEEQDKFIVLKIKKDMFNYIVNQFDNRSEAPITQTSSFNLTADSLPQSITDITLGGSQAFQNCSGTATMNALKMSNLRKTISGDITTYNNFTLTFELNYSSSLATDYTGNGKDLDTMYKDGSLNQATSGRRTIDVILRGGEGKKEDNEYFYFTGRISGEFFFTGCTIRDFPGNIATKLMPVYFETSYGFNDVETRYVECSSNNCLTSKAVVELEGKQEIVYPGNMVIIKSEHKLAQNLCFDTYYVDENNMGDLPFGMYFDTDGFGGITSDGITVQGMFVPVFGNGSPVIKVNSSRYKDEPNIKSVQYYYKDDNGYLHFVFGVNIDKDEAGNNKDMTIYLSCISKRSMKVYDNNHNVIGYAANYADPDNTFQYGTGQYYKEVE